MPTRRTWEPRSASPLFSSWFCFNFPPDVPHTSLFYAYMRGKGIHLWEGRAGFLTTAHTEEDIARVVEAFKETLAEMQAAEFLPAASGPPVPGARRGSDPDGTRPLVRPRSWPPGSVPPDRGGSAEPCLRRVLCCARSTSTRLRQRQPRTPSWRSPSRRPKCGPPRRWAPRRTARSTSVSRSICAGRSVSSRWATRSIKRSPDTRRCARSSLATAAALKFGHRFLWRSRSSTCRSLIE